jgi:hypothetical protein
MTHSSFFLYDIIRSIVTTNQIITIKKHTHTKQFKRVVVQFNRELYTKYLMEKLPFHKKVKDEKEENPPHAQILQSFTINN